MTRLIFTRVTDTMLRICFEPRWPFSLVLEPTYQEVWWTGRQWVDLDSNRPARRRVVDAISGYEAKEAIGQRLAGLMRQEQR